MRQGLVALTLVAVAVVAVAAPAILAATRSHPRLDPAQREAVVTEARMFFDNPIERMLQLSYSVTVGVSGAEPRCPWLVEAFSLFGISAGRVLIECDGDAQRV
jgi:hypothetical protein